MAAPLGPYPTALPAARNEVMTSYQSASPAVNDETQLVVLQHGLWGSVTDLDNVYLTLRSRFGVNARIMSSSVNERGKTMEGIVVGAQRLANFIQVEASRMPKLERISFVGYSLGGIYGRVAIAELYARGFLADPQDGVCDGSKPVKEDAECMSDVDLSEFSDTEVPLPTNGQDSFQRLDGGRPDASSSVGDQEVNHSYRGVLIGAPKWTGRKIRGEHFVTMATPHLGVRKSQEYMLTKIWNWAAEKLTGETGQELLLLDGTVGREPLMVRISRGVFLDALRAFRTRSLYANALNDNTVPFFSAAILLTDVYLLYTPYEVSKVKVMGSNPTIACPEFSRDLRSKSTDLVPHKHVDFTDQHYVACLKAMHKALDSVGWDRYDVVLPGRHTHPHIIVRRPTASTSGFKVLEHLADTLCPETSRTRERVMDRTESAPNLIKTEHIALRHEAAAS